MIIFYKVWVVVDDLGEGDGAESNRPQQNKISD